MQMTRLTESDLEPAPAAAPASPTATIRLQESDLETRPPDFRVTNAPPSPSLSERANPPLIPHIPKAARAIADHGAEEVASAPTWGEKAQGAVELASGALGLTAAMPTARSSQYRLNPSEAAAVQFGREQGIPLDVATQTGSKFARAAQKRIAHTI